MPIFVEIIPFLWVIFILYWFISSFHVKKSIKGGNWLAERFVRIVIILLVILEIRTPLFSQFMWHKQTSNLFFNPFISFLGVLLCAAGIGIAIWARYYLGSNWGMPMSQREKPELIQSGPYAYIRHPIYSGLLLAMLGSTVTIGLFWLIPLAIMLFYFIYSVKIEEKHMRQKFPKEYVDYMNKTKALIPYIW